VHQGLDVVLGEKTGFYPFSFDLEGENPFLYRQYWDEWNRFMVAREISAVELLENLEQIFTRYFRIAAIESAALI